MSRSVRHVVWNIRILRSCKGDFSAKTMWRRLCTSRAVQKMREICEILILPAAILQLWFQCEDWYTCSWAGQCNRLCEICILQGKPAWPSSREADRSSSLRWIEALTGLRRVNHFYRGQTITFAHGEKERGSGRRGVRKTEQDMCVSTNIFMYTRTYTCVHVFTLYSHAGCLGTWQQHYTAGINHIHAVFFSRKGVLGGRGLIHASGGHIWASCRIQKLAAEKRRAALKHLVLHIDSICELDVRSSELVQWTAIRLGGHIHWIQKLLCS